MLRRNTIKIEEEDPTDSLFSTIDRERYRDDMPPSSKGIIHLRPKFHTDDRGNELQRPASNDGAFRVTVGKFRPPTAARKMSKENRDNFILNTEPNMQIDTQTSDTKPDGSKVYLRPIPMQEISFSNLKPPSRQGVTEHRWKPEKLKANNAMPVHNQSFSFLYGDDPFSYLYFMPDFERRGIVNGKGSEEPRPPSALKSKPRIPSNFRNQKPANTSQPVGKHERRNLSFDITQTRNEYKEFNQTNNKGWVSPFAQNLEEKKHIMRQKTPNIFKAKTNNDPNMVMTTYTYGKWMDKVPTNNSPSRMIKHYPIAAIPNAVGKMKKFIASKERINPRSNLK